MFNLKFEIIDYEDCDFPIDNHDFISIVFFNSFNQLYLIQFYGETRVNFSLLWSSESIYDFKKTLLLSKALKNKKQLTTEGFIERIGTASYLSLNILLNREIICQSLRGFNERIFQVNNTILSLMSFFYDYPFFTYTKCQGNYLFCFFLFMTFQYCRRQKHRGILFYHL